MRWAGGSPSSAKPPPALVEGAIEEVEEPAAGAVVDRCWSEEEEGI
jgi:hypothetical protein